MEKEFELILQEQKDCPKYKKEELHIFDALPSGILVNVENSNGKLEYAYSNSFLANSLGYEHQEFADLLKNNCFAAIYEPDREKTVRARSAVLSGKIVDSISRQNTKDGSFVWVLAHIRKINLDGKTGIFFIFSLVQDLIGIQNELSKKNEAWNDISQNVPIGFLVYKEEKGVRTTLSINRALVEFSNSIGSQLDSKRRSWNEAELAMILNQDIFAFCEEEDRHLVAEMLKNCETQPVSSCTFKLRGSNVGSPVFVYATCASKYNSEDSRTYYVTYQNVTDNERRRIELIKKQSQLYKMSCYDSMTGVRNRNSFNKYSESCKSKSLNKTGFVFCDINGLKKTNDSLGHYYGDKLIKQFASILREFFDNDNIYRLSGDEFVVVCPEIERKDFQLKIEYLNNRVEEEGNLASIGCIWKENVSNIQRRVTQAEQIMYIEKQNYYEHTQTINSKHRPQLLKSLLKDFEEGKFVMFLQPKTSIDGSRIIGAEALARKFDTDSSLIQPYSFVPQLEHEKLIPKLDFFMLEQTCRFLQEQHEAGNDSFSVSVNISRVTIAENDFIKTVTTIIDNYNFDRSNLEFELTESTKTLDSLKLEEYLQQLKKLGVKISIDDMGNDYSTLTLLTLEGFDWVKLDRSLIVQLDQEKARILVKHIINTCHDLNLKVIAEGVETDEVRNLLKEMNCDAYQGYLKSRPISVDDFRLKFISDKS